MARANLHVNPAVNQNFYLAQETRDVRFIKIGIDGEDIVVSSVVNKVGDVEHDFDSILVDSLLDTEASIIFLCLTDSPTDSMTWSLITWVPEGCPVRDKMLYSSSKEDLKRAIGLGHFKTEYSANCRSDLKWEEYLDSLKKEFSLENLTESERLLKEEKVIYCHYETFKNHCYLH